MSPKIINVSSVICLCKVVAMSTLSVHLCVYLDNNFLKCFSVFSVVFFIR